MRFPDPNSHCPSNESSPLDLATLIGFSVKASNKILNHAATAGVPVITNTVIYRLMEEVRNRVQALLPPVVEQRVLGEATVQQIFEIKGKAKNVTKIAGCRVTNGVIDRSKKIRVLRNGEEVYTGASHPGHGVTTFSYRVSH